MPSEWLTYYIYQWFGIQISHGMYQLIWVVGFLILMTVITYQLWTRDASPGEDAYRKPEPEPCGFCSGEGTIPNMHGDRKRCPVCKGRRYKET